MPNPSTYTDELAAEICDRLSAGEPLAVICRDEHMPARRTVSDWRRAHPEFGAAFLEARDEGYDSIAQDCLEIADDGRRDYARDEDGHEVVDHDHIQRAKLRVETRLKLLAKWDPRRYGDKVAIEHSGAVRTSRELSDDELARIASGGGEGAAVPAQGPYVVRDLL
jgi:hypothetical protein